MTTIATLVDILLLFIATAMALGGAWRITFGNQWVRLICSVLATVGWVMWAFRTGALLWRRS